MIRSGKTRTHQDREPSPLSRVETTVQIRARLEGREHLLGHRDPFTTARVVPGARVAPLDREHPTRKGSEPAKWG